MRDRERKERGSIIVEATIVLPVFLLAMFIVLNIMRVLILHNRIQFAMNSIAKELSGIAYIYQLSGLNDANKQLDEDFKPYKEKIDEVYESAEKTAGKVKATYESFKKVKTSGLNLANQIAKLPEDLEQAVNTVKTSGTNIITEIKNLPEDAKSLVGDLQKQTTEVFGDISSLPSELKGSYQELTDMTEEMNGLKANLDKANTGLNDLLANLSDPKLSADYINKLKEEAKKTGNSAILAASTPTDIYRIKRQELQDAVTKYNEKFIDVKTKIDNMGNSIGSAYENKKKAITDNYEKIKGVGEDLRTKKDEMMGGVEQLQNDFTEMMDNGSETVKSGKETFKLVMERIKDLKGTAIGAGAIGLEFAINAAKSKLTELYASARIASYLKINGKSADDYLKSYGVREGVKGLSFKASSFLNDEKHRMIDVVVTYKVVGTEYKILAGLGDVELSQRVTIPAWLDGDGKKVDERFKVKK